MAVKKDSYPEEVTIISNGVKIEGTLNSEGNVRIDGSIFGNINVNGNITAGESSELKGEIKARNIILNGKAEGKIFVTEKLRLEPKSKLVGDLTAKTLVIDEGAIFEGRSYMGNSTSSSNLNEK